MWVDHRQCGWQLLVRDVMVGDDDLGIELVGASNRFMGGHAGVACEDEAGSAMDELLQPVPVQAVSFVAGGHAVGDPGAQRAQRLQEEGGRGLPVGVKVTPDGNGLLICDGLPQAVCRDGEVGQIGGRGRNVELGADEGSGLDGAADAATRQRLGNQPRATDDLLQDLGHLDRTRI